MKTSRSNKDPLLSNRQAAAYLKYSPRTLESLRGQKGRPQPRFVRLGTRTVRYRQSDLDAFILARLQGVEDE